MTAFLVVYEFLGLLALIKFVVDCHSSGEFDPAEFTASQWIALIAICMLTGPWLLLPERKVRP